MATVWQRPHGSLVQSVASVGRPRAWVLARAWETACRSAAAYTWAAACRSAPARTLAPVWVRALLRTPAEPALRAGPWTKRNAARFSLTAPQYSLFSANSSVKMSASGQESRPVSYEVRRLERKMGFEPTTLSLARRCSTTEPLPLLLRDGGPLGRHVPRVRIELTTPAFSVLCSTD